MQHIGHIFSKKNIIDLKFEFKWASRILSDSFIYSSGLENLGAPAHPTLLSSSCLISAYSKLTRLQLCNRKSLYFITVFPGLPGKAFSHSYMALRWVFYLAPRHGREMWKERSICPVAVAEQACSLRWGIPRIPFALQPHPTELRFKPSRCIDRFCCGGVYTYRYALENGSPKEAEGRAIAYGPAGDSLHPT